MTDWTTVAMRGIEEFWLGFLSFLPQLILAIIILLLGWIIAVGVGRIIQEILKRLQLDKITQMGKWKESFEKAEFDTTPSEFIGAIFKWILIIVFLSIAVETVGLVEFSRFLNKVVAWLPNLLAAVLIFVVTVVIAGFAEKLVKASVHGARVAHSKLAGSIAKWAVWIFGISAIIVQLLPQVGHLVVILLQGVIALIVIAGGLAFGLGGKEVAGDFLKELRDKYFRE
jgi:hypothetical protein